MWPFVLLLLVAVVLIPLARYRRRHAESAQAQPTWQPTSEVFVDPASQRLMRVWVEPADGTRHYLPD